MKSLTTSQTWVDYTNEELKTTKLQTCVLQKKRYLKFHQILNNIPVQKNDWVLATNSKFLFNIFATWWCKSSYAKLRFWSYITHSLKYLTSMTLSWKTIGIRKSEFAAKTQFLWSFMWYFELYILLE